MKAVLAFILCLMASCTCVQSNSRSNLVGEWRYADDIQSGHYVFEADGTFKSEVIFHQKLISKSIGRWAVKGHSLHYTYIKDELGQIPAGATDRDLLLRVERDFFVIQAGDGKKRKYLRMR